LNDDVPHFYTWNTGRGHHDDFPYPLNRWTVSIEMMVLGHHTTRTLERELEEGDPFNSLQYRSAAFIYATTSTIIGLEDRHVVGHRDLSYPRKKDPGPNFNWTKFWGRVNDYR
jgi:N-acetyl-anhydromuramyl-L-alanine amidase AmpD